MKQVEHDKTIGFCPLIKQICRKDCMMWCEQHGNQWVYSECTFKRAMNEIVKGL